MKKSLLVIFSVLSVQFAFGQNPKFDKLEMLFDQGHYKRVYRKANRLIDDPEYDFSYLPKYYKSLSLLQLSQNRYWLRNHDRSLKEAQQLFLEVKNSEDGEKIFTAHKYELTWVKNDMVSWAADLKRMGLDSEFRTAQELIDVLFEGVDHVEGNENVAEIEIDTSHIDPANLDLRDEILLVAKQQLGVPYVWAGNSPEGFDCSGFTSYVMSKNGKSLPRRAADQYNDGKKVKSKNVREGDLVFFDNGSGISHVGIVVSQNGEPLQMIHSSSSKGIIVTNVSESEYWKKRLYGFATYVD
jgi:hypothetical protein